jgi:hypothetical protein
MVCTAMKAIRERGRREEEVRGSGIWWDFVSLCFVLRGTAVLEVIEDHGRADIEVPNYILNLMKDITWIAARVLVGV